MNKFVRLLLCLALLAFFIIPTVFAPLALATSIDVGSAATDRDSSVTKNYTFIDPANPANTTGTITKVTIYAVTGGTIEGVYVGFVYADGGNYKCRSSASIGNIVGGSPVETSGLSLSVVAGDLMAIYFTAASGYPDLEATSYGSPALLYTSGNQLTPNNSVAYDTLANRGNMSVYAEGATGGVSPPTVTTQAATSVEATTATGNGNITATGGENPNERGICYSSVNNPPTTADSLARETGGSFGTGAYTESLTALSTGTTYYLRAYAINSGGTGYGSTVTILTKPAAPTNVSATDGTYTNKVRISWTKSTGATDYHVWRASVDLGAAGDVAFFDDTGAGAPTITAGTASASDGTSTSYVTLSIAGESANNGATYSYKVVASNASGNSADSATDNGYRGVGTLSYQWQRSAGDSDAAYSNISLATTDPYNDTGAPVDGSGRYYKCVLDATGAAQQTTNADRGYRLLTTPTVTASDATDIGDTYATLNGEIVDTGGANCTIRFAEWGPHDLGIFNATANETGSFGAGVFDIQATGLTPGLLYDFRMGATGPAGTGYSDNGTFLAPPDPPTNVSATDGTYTDKVRITWTKSPGATDYHVWRGVVDLGSAGDVALFDDTGAAAPTITAGSAVASDGSSTDNVSLSLSGTSVANGSSSVYKVVASNVSGNSTDSSTDTGYRGHGALAHQWQRSAGDSDGSYSNITGANSATYSDNSTPAGAGRYWRCVLNATGAAQQISAADRGFKATAGWDGIIMGKANQAKIMGVPVEDIEKVMGK